MLGRCPDTDILLTNYVMLQLILTQSRDRELVREAEALRILVFDELHNLRRPARR